MNENVENLILAQLREIRGEVVGLRGEVGQVRSGLADVDTKIDGVALPMTTLAGYVHRLGERVEALEESRK